MLLSYSDYLLSKAFTAYTYYFFNTVVLKMLFSATITPITTRSGAQVPKGTLKECYSSKLCTYLKGFTFKGCEALNKQMISNTVKF